MQLCTRWVTGYLIKFLKNSRDAYVTAGPVASALPTPLTPDSSCPGAGSGHPMDIVTQRVNVTQRVIIGQGILII